MPPSFRACFPKTRAIIDASEVECYAPGEPTKAVLLYSQYKSRHTFKFLVACAPSGEIDIVVHVIDLRRPHLNLPSDVDAGREL